MTKTELLLIQLSEEAVELSHRCSKAVRFGLKEKQKGVEEDNAERILLEFEDLCGVITLLQGHKILRDTNRLNVIKKHNKIAKYLKYSRQLGILK